MADGETTETAETTAAPESGVDLSPLLERLDEMQEDMSARLGALEGVAAEGGGEPEFEPDPWEVFLSSAEEQEEQPGAAAGMDPRQLAQALQQATEQATRQQIEQLVGPLATHLRELELRLAAQELEAEFPDLADPRVAQEAVGFARQIAEEMGLPELGGHPRLVRTAYLAMRAQQAAQSEVPAGDANVALEGGSSAPGQQAQLSDDEVGNRIVERFVGAALPSGGGLTW